MASFIQLFRAIWAFIVSVFSPSMDKQPILPTHIATTPVEPKVQPPSRQRSLLHPIHAQPLPQKVENFTQETDPSATTLPEKQKSTTPVSGKTGKTHSRARHEPRSPPPEICIQDWSTVGINMADLYIPTLSTIPPPPGSGAAASSNSPQIPCRTSSTPPSPAAPSSNTVVTSSTAPSQLPPTECSDNGPPLPSVVAKNSELPSPNSPSSILSPSNLSSSGLPFNNSENSADGPKSSVATENTKENITIKSEEPSVQTRSVSSLAGLSKALPLTAYATSAVSAMSSYFWDPSLAKTDETHNMPLPLYSSSPPRRRCLSHDASDSPQHLSLLPYPDLFDFGMYSSEFPSNDSLCSVSMNSTRKPLRRSDFSGKSFSKQSPQRDSYRSAAFSRTLSGPRHGPFTLRKSVVLMQAIKQQEAQPNASFGSSTGKEITHDFDVSMDSSTEDRLQEACADLSRGEWTQEEFLKMLTEV
ncbi:uncharacterized protein EV420DRAFT_1498625 [Desarmillaria tabescens]|uniref:EF-hand domain-containing protein n=1 Tax=Armillaria tabescens TaxID=1929756 RepID=A0AA39NR87_ARMTA|nr:uncharacterized protein EV420DRAFT_1498625 [Desarmillaria tabescens]KAK0470149.1 hypothetical protein EV420DRAFT_1498625 [Desarmillaria tabescens]